MRVLPSLALLAALLAPAVAHAGERNYGITEFDRIRVEGPLDVTITTGGGVSARAEGDAAALDALTLRVDGRMLVVRMAAAARGAFADRQLAAPSVRLTTPTLRAAILTGAGRIAVDRMRGDRIDLTVTGSGRIAAPRIEGDRLAASLIGSGSLVVAGRTPAASFVSRGAGTIDAAELAVNELTVSSESAGEARFIAERTARVTATGAGSIAIAGPANCIVRATGAGEVSCGKSAGED